MSLYTIRCHTAYFCGEKADGTPVFKTSSKNNRRAGWAPKIFTSKAAANRIRKTLPLYSSTGFRPKISNVRTVNRVLG